MIATPQQIAALRKADREQLSDEKRQLRALEEISDTLEAIRAMLHSALSAPNRSSGLK